MFSPSQGKEGQKQCASSSRGPRIPSFRSTRTSDDGVDYRRNGLRPGNHRYPSHFDSRHDNAHHCGIHGISDPGASKRSGEASAVGRVLRSPLHRPTAQMCISLTRMNIRDGPPKAPRTTPSAASLAKEREKEKEKVKSSGTQVTTKEDLLKDHARLREKAASTSKDVRAATKKTQYFLTMNGRLG